MFVKGFSIGIDKNKRLWLIMIGAVTIAVLLIVISFISVYKGTTKNSKIVEALDISNISSYKANYTLNVKSNKNQNNYMIEEEYRDGEKEFFEFKVTDIDEIITYTLDNNTLHIQSNKQNLNYLLSDYIVKKENLISVSTFFELYEKAIQDDNKYFSVSIEEQDNKLTYIIKVAHDENLSDEYTFLNNVSKLELIINKEKNTFEEYVLYDDNANAYIDIIYDNFLINN